jgi:hypothetical protein
VRIKVVLLGICVDIMRRSGTICLVLKYFLEGMRDENVEGW